MHIACKNLVSRNVHNLCREASAEGNVSTCPGPSAVVSWGCKLALIGL